MTTSNPAHQKKLLCRMTAPGTLHEGFSDHEKGRKQKDKLDRQQKKAELASSRSAVTGWWCIETGKQPTHACKDVMQKLELLERHRIGGNTCSFQLQPSQPSRSHSLRLNLHLHDIGISKSPMHHSYSLRGSMHTCRRSLLEPDEESRKNSRAARWHMQARMPQATP